MSGFEQSRGRKDILKPVDNVLYNSIDALDGITYVKLRIKWEVIE